MPDVGVVPSQVVSSQVVSSQVVSSQVVPGAASPATARHLQEGARRHGQPRPRSGCLWLTGPGVLRYSLAVRAPLRAVRVPRDPSGGRAAPSTYDLTK